MIGAPASYDTRDAQEHADVAAVLEELPADHPGRDAYAGSAGTLGLTHLVADRPELVERLKEAFLSGFWCMFAGAGGFRP